MDTATIGFDQDRLRLLGSRPGMSGRRQPTFGKDRVCGSDGCDTVLSRYNQADLGWQHEPRHEFISAVRGRRPTEVEVLSELLPVGAN
jgi:hypothetical protein